MARAVFSKQEMKTLREVCEKEKQAKRETKAKELTGDFMLWGETYQTKQTIHHSMSAKWAIGIREKKAAKLRNRMTGWLIRSPWFKPEE